MEHNDKSQITALLANEQTFLAWLRTGIEVMALGFVAIKFSLFTSQVIGIILVGTGTVMTGLSYGNYRSTIRRLRNGEYSYNTLLLSLVTAVIMIISTILLYCIVDAYLNPDNSHATSRQEKERTEKLS
jgi:inner membrane protein YidH